MTTTTLLRPAPAEEARLEVAAREAGGPLAFVRRCGECNTITTPTGSGDAQSCGTCDHPFPGTPFTWRIAEDPDLGTVLILRRGDYVWVKAVSPTDQPNVLARAWRVMQQSLERATA